jgi:uncharacterized coiled-coil protein SlyX
MSQPDIHLKEISDKTTQHMKTVVDARDKLDEFISELTSLKEDCDEAYEDLWRARDTLSRWV